MNLNGRRILFQLLGGIGFSIVFGGTFFLIQVISNPNFPWNELKIAGIILTVYAVVFSLIGWALSEFFFKNQPSPRMTFPFVARGVFFLFLVGIVGTLVGDLLVLWILPTINLFQLRPYFSTVFYVVFLGSPLFLYLTIKELWKEALQKVKEKELAQERLEKELLAAQLKNLQSQVNPHFLFNTLNSIAALIASNPRQAEKTVEQLADLFRYALECNHGSSISLAEEIKIIEDYLAIEKVRFGSRLTYRVCIDPQVSNFPIPPLLLQPLVENAIKHGINKREENGEVLIQVGPLDGKMELRVENDGPPLSQELTSSGVGLNNMESRCRLVYGDQFHFELKQIGPNRTCARLRLPIVTGAAPDSTHH